MLFWNEHKDDIECMHYCRSRYVKVVNGDGASVTTKVAVKQLHYMPITLRLKRLYLSEEIAFFLHFLIQSVPPEWTSKMMKGTNVRRS
jgi:hypothetical protein